MALNNIQPLILSQMQDNTPGPSIQCCAGAMLCPVLRDRENNIVLGGDQRRWGLGGGGGGGMFPGHSKLELYWKCLNNEVSPLKLPTAHYLHENGS